jgi:hypothetical protein
MRFHPTILRILQMPSYGVLSISELAMAEEKAPLRAKAPVP